MLHIDNFQKTYQQRTVLRIDAFTIKPGLHWVKGSNGSGKSTLLKALAGLISFQGEVVLNERFRLKRQPVAYRKQVNFAEAEPIFPPFLTGTELIRLFSTAKGSPPNQADEFIESWQMASYVGEPVGRYSSGMLKKLSLVLAFLGQPALILLDEPLITLDAQALRVLYAWIDQQSRQQGTSFLLSSHQPLDSPALPALQHLLIDGQTIHHRPCSAR